jgi:hypothetical protein
MQLAAQLMCWRIRDTPRAAPASRLWRLMKDGCER